MAVRKAHASADSGSSGQGLRAPKPRSRSFIPTRIAKQTKGRSPNTDKRQADAPGIPKLRPLYAEFAQGDRVRLCGPIAVTSLVATTDQKDPGLKIHYRRILGGVGTTILPLRLLTSPKATAEFLIKSGIKVDHTPRGQKALSDQLSEFRPRRRLLLAPHEGLHRIRVGEQTHIIWTTSRASYGTWDSDDISVELHDDAQPVTSTCGSLEAWKDAVLQRASSNPFLVFALSLPFAAATLRLCDLQGFVVALVADTSSGKSTLLRTAQSVFCDPTDLFAWHGTSNGIEAFAAARTDHALILDELAQADARALAQLAFTLANQSTKLRSLSDGRPAPHEFARVIGITSSERDPVELAINSGRPVTEGYLARVLPMKLERTFRAFDKLHGAPSGAAFAEELSAAARANYGWPWQTFVEYLVTHHDEVKQLVAARRQVLARKLFSMVTEPNNPSLVHRVAEHFAVVYLAASVAADAGVLEISRTELRNAVTEAFRVWHSGFLENYVRVAGDPLPSVQRAVAKLPHQTVTKLSHWKRFAVNEDVVFRHTLDGEDVLLFRHASFDKWLAQKHGHARTVRALREKKILVTERPDTATVQVRLPGAGGRRERFFALRIDLLKSGTSM